MANSKQPHKWSVPHQSASKTRQRSALFADTFDKPVVSVFDSDVRSSDGGITLLGAIDRKTKLTEILCAALSDARDPSRVQHPHINLLRQRVLSIAAGYPDGNDAKHIGDDPVMKIVCTGKSRPARSLASQPTLSRFENSVTARDAVQLGRALEGHVIERLRKLHPKARLITIDLDGTCDRTHGQQLFSFYSGCYDTWCYFPLLGFLSVDDKPSQYLFHARLRPGASREARSTPALLRRTVASLRKAFKKATIRVRLDAGFASPQIYETLEDLEVEYVVGLPENPVLNRGAARTMHAASVITDTFGGTTTLFGEVQYMAKSWKKERRVIYKAEVLDVDGKAPRANRRFVVTNLPSDARPLWEMYCRRGDSENRIKELKNDLSIDRTSCPSYVANQVRVLLAAAAFVLFQELRQALGDLEMAKLQVATIRARLLKIGATVKESARRIVISMPACFPWKEPWVRAATAVASMA